MAAWINLSRKYDTKYKATVFQWKSDRLLVSCLCLLADWARRCNGQSCSCKGAKLRSLILALAWCLYYTFR